jgi:hypothetical protein
VVYIGSDVYISLQLKQKHYRYVISFLRPITLYVPGFPDIENASLTGHLTSHVQAEFFDLTSGLRITSMATRSRTVVVAALWEEKSVTPCN